MVEIIEPKIGNWCLRGRSNQCWMICQSSYSCIKSGIRSTILSNFTIVVLNIFYQPVYSVIRISTFVHIFFSFVIYLRCHIRENSFAHISATNVLKNEDVFFLFNKFVGIQFFSKVVLSIRRDAVTCSVHDKRVFFPLGNILWSIDNGEQFSSISHRDINFFFGIIILNLISLCCA